MALAAGTRLGLYEILEPLGAGGMGEVYRARDTKLGREVAVKVLPEDFAQSEERLSRFEREARVLASLNHPHIATLHGFEEEAETRFLVMELVEGEDLAARLERGPLPLPDALPLFLQVAEGLEAAHEKGVIHRDLKPANLKVTEEGMVKILDFGLAKATPPSSAVAGSDLSQSPTQSATHHGQLIGTAAYMSPEQARGRGLDKRTDIWSFGCVLYEALTGRAAFRGETVSDTIARVLEREPDWEALPEATPAPIRRLLHRCLQKDPRQRLHDIADARIELHETLASPAAGAPVPAPARRSSLWRGPLPWGFAALIVAAAGVGVWSVRQVAPPLPPALTHHVVPLDPAHELPGGPAAPMAISPDGTHLVYAAHPRGETSFSGRSLLYLRRPGEFEARPIPGTVGAQSPFFSPDGQWVGFLANDALFKVSLTGRAPEKICDTSSWSLRGASWGPDDTIIFARVGDLCLWRVSASGAAPEQLTRLDEAGGEIGHRDPQTLPNGRDVLFTVEMLDLRYRAAILSLETGRWRILEQLGEARGARYLPTGHLVYGQAKALFAVPFDQKTLEPVGTPIQVVDDILSEMSLGFYVPFTVSETGTLVYVPAGEAAAEDKLVWVDREGRATPFLEEPVRYSYPRLSPDGKRAAVVKVSESQSDIWIHDIERGTATRVTTKGLNTMPTWTPDGQRVAFASNRTGSMLMYWKRADGSGEAELLRPDDVTHASIPRSFTPDGAVLAFDQPDPGFDSWTLSMDGSRHAEPFLATPATEAAMGFSPDGRWLAYYSDVSGRFEVYVQPYPGPGRRWMISTEGGTEPVWSADGRELFYRQGHQMMVVDMMADAAFAPGKPRRLFEGYETDQWGVTNYAVSPDGERFLMVQRERRQAPSQLHVVLNWFKELERRVPTH